MQVEYKTGKGTLVFIKLKENKNLLRCEVPKNFEFIGLTSDITEEQAKMMIDLDRYQLGCCRYKNYNSNNMENISPIDSFKSIMQYIQVHEVNPLGDFPTLVNFRRLPISMVERKQERWQEAQTRTGKWVILFKPN